MSIVTETLKAFNGLVSGLKWWGKRKEKEKREKALDAVIANKLHNARLRKDGRKRNSDNR